MNKKKIIDTKVLIIDGDRGKNYPSKEELMSTGYCIFLNNKNLLGDTLSLKDCDYISKEKDLLLRNGKLNRGDIVVSTRGSIGNIGYYSKNIKHENLRINSGMVILRNQDSEIDTRFLHQYLKSDYVKQQFEQLSTGSVQKQLPIKSLQNLEVNLPDLPTQEKIADFLSSLDDKIEINNKINQKLEELGQALYTKWFVNFDFPNEEGKPYKSSGGEMIESELGMIPKGWRVSDIDSNMKTILGGTPPRKKYECWDGDINWINSGKVSNLRVFDHSEKISELGLKYSELMPEGTTLISITGNIYVSLLECDSCANQSVVGILENDSIPKEYIYYMVRNKINEFKTLMIGAVQKHINKDVINNTKILLPSKDLLLEFRKAISPLFETIKNNNIENQKLAELRDFLIPQLMSGNLEIKDLDIIEKEV